MTTFAEQFPIVFQALNEGFLQTLKLFFITLIGAIPLGLIISFGSMSAWRPFRVFRSVKWLSEFKPVRAITRLVIWVVRGTPLMLQLLVIYYFPGLVWKNNIWGSGEAGRFVASSVAFVFNYACYFSEIYRGGIQGVPKGQQEAGQVLGMTKGQIFFKVVLLQVVKKITAPLGNEIITLVKDTSLSSVIAIPEILMRAKDFSMQGLIWPLFYSAVFFLAFCGILTLLFSFIEKKLDYYKG